ncbi:MAG: pseudouridine synthase [Candidatus Eisenbacteria bacterium]
MSIRLNKLLANRGIGARRKCDLLIQEGYVRVNGRVVTEPGTTVDEQRDRVEVKGQGLPGRQKLVYWVINKPVGVITTLDDPQGRPTIASFLPRGARLFPVGRLDADTSGLLLLTNDGELAHKLMHPRYGVQKFYRVRLDREPTRSQLDRLERGVEFEPGVVSAPARARRIDPGFDAIMIEVVVHEGRFRQVRRMCEKVGLRVTGLHRTGYGPIRLGPLSRGMYRELSEEEVAKLVRACARPMRRDGAGDKRAKPGAAPRPAESRRERMPAPREEDDVEEMEETWIAGGGFAPELDDDDDGGSAAESVWPARAGGRRGDAGFGGGEPRDTKREGGMPWHAPEYRRGGAPREERASEPAARTGKPGRRAQQREADQRRVEREAAPSRDRDRALERVRLKGQRREDRREGRERTAPVEGPRRRFGDRPAAGTTRRESTERATPRGRGSAPRGGALERAFGERPRRAPAESPRGRFGAPRRGEGDAPPRGRFGAPRRGEGDAPSRGRFGAPRRGEGDAPPRGRFGAPRRGEGDAPPRGRFGAPRRGEGDAPPRGRFGAPRRGEGDAPPRGPALRRGRRAARSAAPRGTAAAGGWPAGAGEFPPQRRPIRGT